MHAPDSFQDTRHRPPPFYLQLEGTPYELGRQHGTQLASQIHAAVDLWAAHIERLHGTSADAVVHFIHDQTRYLRSVERYTPALLDEARGIAQGADIDFDWVFAFQCMDEISMRLGTSLCDRCTALGMMGTANRPSLIAQNMDLEGFRNGFQTVLHIHHPDPLPDMLLFTCAGMIALNGVNDRGVAVCVNALRQLDRRLSGLPVAFLIRGLLQCSRLREAVAFVNGVHHATGQNYVIGSADKVDSFECSAGKVVPGDTADGMRPVVHTNHPLWSTDFENGYAASLADRDMAAMRNQNSEVRLRTAARLLAENGGNVRSVQTILASGHPEHPISRPFVDLDSTHTFGSTIMLLTDPPQLWMTPGPPHVNQYIRFSFPPA